MTFNGVFGAQGTPAVTGAVTLKFTLPTVNLMMVLTGSGMLECVESSEGDGLDLTRCECDGTSGTFAEGFDTMRRN